MLARLALLFVTVPLLELALLVWIGERVGLVPTIALVVITGLTGAALARHQGLATWQRFQEALAQGRAPHRELVDGLLILVAAAVLLTPGVLTDLLGFTLLVPPLRRALAARLGAAFGRRVVAGGATGFPPPDRGAAADAVEVEFTVEEDPPAEGS